MDVEFLSQIPDYQLYNTRRVRDVLRKCAQAEKRGIQRLTYRFVTDEDILSINKTFLQHNYITDILTFDNSFLGKVEGDIYICIPEVRRNAKRHAGNNFNEEVHRVILHGLLHLIGYNDSSEEESRIMREKESFYLRYL